MNKKANLMKRSKIKAAIWVLLSLIQGIVSAFMCAETDLADSMIATKVSALVAIAAVVLAVFGVFLTMLFGDLMRKIVSKKERLTEKERVLVHSFSFTLLSSVGVLGMVCIMMIWGSILGDYPGEYVEVYFENSFLVERISMAVVNFGLSLELFSVVYAVYPLIQTNYSLRLEEKRNDYQDSFFNDFEDG